MKPRYRLRANGAFEFLTHDGFIPVPSLEPIAPRAADTRCRLTSKSYERLLAVKFLPRLPVVGGDHQPASVSVSGDHALPSLLSGSARLAPDERQVVIDVPESFFLPALRSSLTPQNPQLPRGRETLGAFLSKSNNHVSLPHGETVTRFISHRREK